MVIVETSIFTRVIQDLMTDEEYAEFQMALAERPDMGPVIPGSGGLRKVRWRLEGRGKRGGVRVIHYWLSDDEQLRMLFAYAKARQEDLTKAQLDTLREIVEKWSDG